MPEMQVGVLGDHPNKRKIIAVGAFPYNSVELGNVELGNVRSGAV